MKWKEDYGFIRQIVTGCDNRDRGVDRYVDISNVVCGTPVLKSFARFDLAPGRNGKSPQAVNVEFVEPIAPSALSVLGGVQ